MNRRLNSSLNLRNAGMNRNSVFGVLFLLCWLLPQWNVDATKWPNYYWDIQGVVKDWNTKKPIQGARVLVFLDGASMYQGFNPEQGDYPDLPQTSAQGIFFATALLYRTPPKDRPETIEAVVMAEGYRTERFKFAAQDVIFEVYPNKQTNSFGLIQLPVLEISRYEHLAGGSFLVKDSEAAVRTARAAVFRRGLDTSSHDMGKPQSVQESVSENRKVWRVAFGLKEPVKGGQIVVTVDAKTGRCRIGFGE